MATTSIHYQQKLKKHYSEVFDCPSWTGRCFEEVAKELGIVPDKVKPCRSYMAQIPCVVGILQPRIILPVEEYDKETLRMILLHELTHYKK